MTTTPPLDPVREKFHEYLRIELSAGDEKLFKDWSPPRHPATREYRDRLTQARWLLFQSAYASGHEAGVREERGRCAGKVRAIPTRNHGWNTLSYAQGVNKAIEVIEGTEP